MAASCCRPPTQQAARRATPCRAEPAIVAFVPSDGQCAVSAWSASPASFAFPPSCRAPAEAATPGAGCDSSSEELDRQPLLVVVSACAGRRENVGSSRLREPERGGHGCLAHLTHNLLVIAIIFGSFDAVLSYRKPPSAQARMPSWVTRYTPPPPWFRAKAPSASPGRGKRRLSCPPPSSAP